MLERVSHRIYIFLLHSVLQLACKTARNASPSHHSTIERENGSLREPRRPETTSNRKEPAK